MRFEFATAARIIFGPGTVAEVAPAAREMGRRALLVTGRGAGRAADLIRSLTGIERGVRAVRREGRAHGGPCAPGRADRSRGTL